MTDAPNRPEQSIPGAVADAVEGNWVDTFAPVRSRPFLRLSRADRPAGTWLLFIPCLWSIFLAAATQDGLGWHGLWVLIACGAGAFWMRGAGCTWNDFADRKVDAQVTRTKSRPLPSGQVTPKAALVWMCVQALIALAFLLSLNGSALLWGIASLVPVCVYPFAKRFTNWPQAVLGMAINWGALLGWVALSGTLAWPAVCLYLTGVFWTLYYDTIYAHQDRDDDAVIGVKSTARILGENTPLWLNAFRRLSTAFALAACASLLFTDENILSFIISALGCVAFYLHTEWQMRQLDINDPDTCLKLFRGSRDAGLIFAGFLWMAVLV